MGLKPAPSCSNFISLYKNIRIKIQDTFAKHKNRSSMLVSFPFSLFQETHGNNQQRKPLKKPFNLLYDQQKSENSVSIVFSALSFVRQNNLQEGEKLRCQDSVYCSKYCLLFYTELKSFDDLPSIFSTFRFFYQEAKLIKKIG